MSTNTTYAQTLQALRDAKRVITTAIKDLDRMDRIDALDSIDHAQRRLEDAKRSIRESLPKECRT